MQNKGIIALQEYQEKVKQGIIPRSKQLDPIEKVKQNPKSLRLALNAKCFECSSHQRKEVTDCTVTDCPLWHQRPWQKKAAA